MPRADRAKKGAALAALLLTGCAGPIADWVVEAPNRRGVAAVADSNLFREALNAEAAAIETPTGMLHFLRVPSRPYEVTLKAEVAGESRDGGREVFTSWSFREADERKAVAEPRGTVVMLHGFEMTKEVMGSFAALMADAGFDVVLVDLPGHGESEGDFVTWGVREAPAINALRRRLEAEGAARPLIAFGVSLGGSVAIRAAATEAGWDAVIAQQPFEDPARVIPNFRAMAPAWLRSYVSDRRLAKAMGIAETRAGFDFEDARLAPLLADYDVPTLIEHGEVDRLVPLAESEAFAAAAPQAVTLLVDADGDHFTLPLMLWRRCPNVLGWLGEQFALARPDTACARIIYQDPDGFLDAAFDDYPADQG